MSLNRNALTVASALMAFGFFSACKSAKTEVEDEGESEIKFASGVHLLLGDEGFADACKGSRVNCSNLGEIKRADGKRAFSYGELIALSGDFYADPISLFEEKNPKTMLEQLKANDTVDVTNVYFRSELASIYKIMNGHSKLYPNFDKEYAFNVPAYLKLAEHNVSHFGWHNMLVYIKYHEKSIEIARKSHLETDKKAKAALLRRALYFNAFADHFLTDGFAAGHIRVPRREIAIWCKDQHYDAHSCGSLVKLFHDHDGSLEEGNKGLAVMNASGQSWLTRTDSELFIGQVTADPGISVVIQAVKVSVQEVFTAYKNNTVPEGVYEAANLVAFPDTGAESFTDKYSKLTKKEIASFIDDTAWYMQVPGLETVDALRIRSLSKAMPRLLDEFRNSVLADINTNKVVKKRLPEAYINGFATMK